MLTAMELCKQLKLHGYKSYFVGGFVRDYILKKEYSDIDIATDATPEKIINIFTNENFRVIPIYLGIKHGTITVIHNKLSPNKGYEITTFRRDISCDGRHAEVAYCEDIIEDLKRRDFTINAMAINPFTNELIDPFGGQRDIKNKVINCVGNADDRVREDSLRIIRACRFAATLKFKINIATLSAMFNNGYQIKNISAERIKSEIDKCFAKADVPSIMFYYMAVAYIMEYVIPELVNCYGFKQNKYHKYNVFHHIMETVDAVPKEYPLIRWAALFHDMGKPESCKNYGYPDASFHNHEFISERISKEIMDRLRFSNVDKEYIANLVKHHMFKYSNKMTDSAIRRFVSRIGEENIDAICILKYADRIGAGKEVRGGALNIEGTGLKRRLLELKSKESVFKISDMHINGHDVMRATGLPPGKGVGEVLKKLFDLVMEDPSINKNEILLEKAKELVCT